MKNEKTDKNENERNEKKEKKSQRYFPVTYGTGNIKRTVEKGGKKRKTGVGE